MDTFTLVFQALFYGVFAVTLLRYWRRRGALELAVVLVFAPMAVLFAVTALNLFIPGASTTLRPVSTTVLLLQPVLVLRLVALIRPLPRWVMPLVWIGFVVNALSINVFDRSVPSLIAYVAFFFAVEAAAAWRLVDDARRRFGLARLRLVLAGAATACFGLSILIAGLGSAAAGGGGAQVPGAIAVSRFLALAAGLGYVAAFMAPHAIRRVALQSVAFGLTRRLGAAPAESAPELLWSELAATAREILGARRVDVVASGGPDPIATLGEVGRAIRAAGVVPAPNASPITTTQVTVPLRSQAGWAGELRAEVDGRPLFVEDDLALLELLGSLTANTVERLGAFLRLEEAQRSLAETAAVRTSEARFRALLEADPNAILALDTDGVITWATRQAGELFGEEPDALIGTPLNELVPVAAGPTAPAVPDARGVLRAETTARRRDGTHFPAEMARTEFELDGQPFQVAVVSDVSWRHEADQIRERFVGVLSHELRTPVTSIYGGAQLLLTRGSRLDQGTQAELLATIAGESERLQRIIENLVVLARIERGAELGGAHPVLLDRLLADLVARERTLWPGGTIRLTVEQRLPVVAADDDHIGQVVRNLVSNAAKYAGDGATVDVSAGLEDDAVVVRVSDDGPGISAAEADRLFTLYYRSTEHAGVAGAGMGLFVCQQLVEAMGGRIWARRRGDRGSEFGFSLPIYVDELATLEDGGPTPEIDAIARAAPGRGAAGRTPRVRARPPIEAMPSVMADGPTDAPAGVSASATA